MRLASADGRSVAVKTEPNPLAYLDLGIDA